MPNKYAATSYQNAVRQMNEADAIATGKHENKKSLISLSREVVQTAEDAREIAVKNIDEERSGNGTSPRRIDREAASRNRADEESQRRLNAEARPLTQFATEMKRTDRISMRKPPRNKRLGRKPMRREPQ